jgi:hypothetical protein
MSQSPQKLSTDGRLGCDLLPLATFSPGESSAYSPTGRSPFPMLRAFFHEVLSVWFPESRKVGLQRHQNEGVLRRIPMVVSELESCRHAEVLNPWY